MNNINNEIEFSVYTWRLCPAHLWHEMIINLMRERFRDKFLLILWSSTANFSLRNFFNYEERRGFVKKIFPDQGVVGLSDYSTDREWLLALDDMISNIFKISHEDIKKKVVFAWWCHEDIDFFLQDWRQIEIVNRFDWSTPKISATEVRDALIYDRNLDWLLNPIIASDIKDLFKTKWEKFKKI